MERAFRTCRAAVVTLAALIVAVAAGCSDAARSQSDGKPAGGSSAAPVAELMCPEHGVTEKFCTICHPEIKNDPNILLCKEHYDIPEDICTACHPELKAKIKTCPHELPTAFCQECQKAKGGEQKAQGQKG